MKFKALPIAALLVSLLLPACKSLKECQEDSAKLSNDVQTLNTYIEAIQKKSSTEIAGLKAQKDSLTREIQVLQELTPAELLALRDSLQNRVGILTKRNEDALTRNACLADTLRDLKVVLHSLFGLPGNKATQIAYNNHTYDCYIVDTKQSDLQFFWKDPQGKPVQSLANLANITEQNGKTLVFATNAGMYKPDRSPQGLYIQNGKSLIPIDRRKDEYGNFYMQPNGVFMIDTGNMANILVTEKFDDKAVKQAKFATQSGPMAVIDGKINAHFNIDSENKNIRSGVGIINSSTIVFVISNQPVNFHDFASVFKNEFKCANALYLDGAISEMFLPETGRFQKGGSFGPIIGILKK